ncbi:MAG TPA: chemotaxis protein CheB [Lachnospiraceae bacterium]|nr:chemotaxis protein CheB [Lachnospiraceae bacterium]
MPSKKQEAKTRTLENCIVALGASAGGLEALQAFFTALPMDTGIPYVVIQHLSPDYKSMLSEILSKSTDMPVMQVENGTELQPNHVYVIAPGKMMKLSNGRIRLTKQDKTHLSLPIDEFFRSLAEETEGGAIAIILSGTGSDGSGGIKDIKEHGGVIFVQEPDSCKFDSMPRNAIGTGLVDAALSPELLAAEVAEITDLLNGKLKPIEHEVMTDSTALETIYDTLKKVRNINFRQYRQETMLRRIERRMILMHKETLAEYADFVVSSQEECKALANDMLIGVTRFFRDPDCFEALRKNAICNILQNSSDEQIRVWVPGCSTGEEAYSIAILMKEELERLKIKRDVKIFATDLDEEAITFAANGVYGENIIESVSISRLGRFFIRREKEYQIIREIRQMVVFSPHNVFADAPFGRLDLVSCRNMLIYFQPALQNDLFAIFHMALKDKGYLFLGKSENIGNYSKAFITVDSGTKLFVHDGNARIPGQKNLPFLQGSMGRAKTGKASKQLNESAPLETHVLQDGDYLARNTALFEEFMPACVIVNEKNDIIHFLGDYDNYFRKIRGKTTTNLFDLLTDGLKATISTLLKEARESKHKVQYKDIGFHGELRDEVITVTVAPMDSVLSETGELYAIVFADKGQRGEIKDAVNFEIDRISAKRISDLEQENKEIRSQLMQGILEKESSNEELQAANEEMLTSNEELQSSNEELQSVNEELYTVNAEYQLKLDEVRRLNDDITNFLSSTMVGVIFIDHEQIIKRFTQYVAIEFAVMEQDIGRPISCMAYNFISEDIEAACAQVLKTLIPIERELQTNKDKTFFTRIAPYCSAENKVLGCVLTFVDTTSLKAGQRDLAEAVKNLSVAREEAVEANHAKSDFLSRMSHDIRTPLNAIIGSVNLAMEENNPAETNELLTSVNVASKYLLGLINDILDLSKIENGKIELNEEPYTRREFLLNINTVIKPLMDFKNIQFTIKYDGNGECVIVDQLRFNQIFFNLLSNAAKFTPEGGSVGLTLEQIHDHNGKYGMRYYVRDTGIGMSDEFQRVCFESFVQERANQNEESKGSGLGLAIVKHLVEEMGGTIRVKSELGKGTEFILEFYLNTIERASEPSISLEIDYSVLNGCHVLLVDDNEINLMITEKILERKGCIIETAMDGAEAVDIFKASETGSFDIIITDIRMPIMDGLEETRQIRALKRSDATTVPIVALTADAFNEEREKTVDAGMTARLIKPVEPDLLYATVSNLIHDNSV